MQNFRAIEQLFMEILHFKELGDTECCHKCSLCVDLVIDNFVCTFWWVTPVSNFKANGQLAMEIWHFKNLGNTVSVITNAIVLVLRVSYFNTNISLGGYLPSYKVLLQCIGNWQCYATLKSFWTDRHTDTHTDTQPQYNSFANRFAAQLIDIYRSVGLG